RSLLARRAGPAARHGPPPDPARGPVGQAQGVHRRSPRARYSPRRRTRLAPRPRPAPRFRAVALSTQVRDHPSRTVLRWAADACAARSVRGLLEPGRDWSRDPGMRDWQAPAADPVEPAHTPNRRWGRSHRRFSWLAAFP